MTLAVTVDDVDTLIRFYAADFARFPACPDSTSLPRPVTIDRMRPTTVQVGLFLPIHITLFILPADLYLPPGAVVPV